MDTHINTHINTDGQIDRQTRTRTQTHTNMHTHTSAHTHALYICVQYLVGEREPGVAAGAGMRRCIILYCTILYCIVLHYINIQIIFFIIIMYAVRERRTRTGRGGWRGSGRRWRAGSRGSGPWAGGRWPWLAGRYGREGERAREGGCVCVCARARAFVCENERGRKGGRGGVCACVVCVIMHLCAFVCASLCKLCVHNTLSVRAPAPTHMRTRMRAQTQFVSLCAPACVRMSACRSLSFLSFPSWRERGGGERERETETETETETERDP
jgi:hypothetical protein